MLEKTTITISLQTKKLLEKEKRGMTWDTFLRELLKKAKMLDKLLAAMELNRMFTEEDAIKMEKILEEVKLKWTRKANL